MFLMNYIYRLTSFLFCCVFFFEAVETSAQDIPINRDETKVTAYTLPDPLQGADGKKVTTAQQWVHQQRAVMLKLFADNVYGRIAVKPGNMRFKITSVDSFALGGSAI